MITSANLATLSGGVLGIDVNLNCQLIPSGTKVVFRNGIVTTEHCAMHIYVWNKVFSEQYVQSPFSPRTQLAGTPSPG